MKALKYYFIVIAVFLLSFSALSQTVVDTTEGVPVPGDTILRIDNLNSQKDSAKINEIIAVKLATKKPVSTFTTLYVDGIKINNLKPWKSSECDKTVFFQLNDSIEKLLLQFTASKSADRNIIAVNFSVGTASQCLAKASDPVYVEVKQRIQSAWVWLMSLLILILVIAALKKNALKDDNNLYYSLGRTQLFFWTILFVISYLYICFETGELPDIPGSVLVILGISVGTTAASKVIENKDKPVAIIDPNAKSEGWFMDILSDGSSINIQRFQNVVFNLVFGTIFIQKTISTEVMPAFDNNALLLLGISSGAYAGLKLTEATKDQNQPPAPVNSDPPPTPAQQPAQAPAEQLQAPAPQPLQPPVEPPPAQEGQ